MEKKKKEHSFIYKKPSTWIGKILERVLNKKSGQKYHGNLIDYLNLKEFDSLSELYKVYDIETSDKIYKIASKVYGTFLREEGKHIEFKTNRSLSINQLMTIDKLFQCYYKWEKQKYN